MTINGIAFEGWAGGLAGHNDAGDEKPSRIETQKLYADDVAAYTDLATWRNLPSATTTYTVVLPGGDTVTGCFIYQVEPVRLIAHEAGSLLVVVWLILPPETW